MTNSLLHKILKHLTHSSIFYHSKNIRSVEIIQIGIYCVYGYLYVSVQRNMQINLSGNISNSDKSYENEVAMKFEDELEKYD